MGDVNETIGVDTNDFVIKQFKKKTERFNMDKHKTSSAHTSSAVTFVGARPGTASSERGVAVERGWPEARAPAHWRVVVCDK